MKHYLEANRGKNVVTPISPGAIEESTHTNVDQFSANGCTAQGAPKFDLGYAYAQAKEHQVALTVKQTQTAEGRVGMFPVPLEVENYNRRWLETPSITVSKPLRSSTLLRIPCRSSCSSIRAATCSSPLNFTRKERVALSIEERRGSF